MRLSIGLLICFLLLLSQCHPEKHVLPKFIFELRTTWWRYNSIYPWKLNVLSPSTLCYASVPPRNAEKHVTLVEINLKVYSIVMLFYLNAKTKLCCKNLDDIISYLSLGCACLCCVNVIPRNKNVIEFESCICP